MKESRNWKDNVVHKISSQFPFELHGVAQELIILITHNGYCIKQEAAKTDG